MSPFRAKLQAVLEAPTPPRFAFGDLPLLMEVGMILEFGVAYGITFNELCRAVAPHPVYGFDWFHGLPEDWKPQVGRGAFSTKGVPPAVETNGKLVIGLVQHTLAGFLQAHPEPLAFAHFDMDLYSATSVALMMLADAGRCRPGVIMLFDEITIADGGVDHEQKAFAEFLEAAGFDFELVGRRSATAYAFRLV
jgi:hypothetical protein